MKKNDTKAYTQLAETWDSDFVWSASFDPKFLAALMYEGYLPTGHDSRGIQSHVVLPKLHQSRYTYIHTYIHTGHDSRGIQSHVVLPKLHQSRYIHIHIYIHTYIYTHTYMHTGHKTSACICVYVCLYA